MSARTPGGSASSDPTSIERTWTRFPPERYTQEEVASYLPRWIAGDALAAATRFFSRSAVASRHLVVSPEEMLLSGRSFAERNEVYRRTVQREIGGLCEEIRDNTPRAVLDSVDFLVTASCTGFQIPAMDALVIQSLQLPLSLRRINLTEHGCSAGAAALGMAHEWLAARPRRRALVIACELCSLTFQMEDTSPDNMVSAAIFGDGAAAVLLAGAAAEPAAGAPGLLIRDTWREFFPATEHFMGFEVNDLGFKIKLSRDIVPFSQSQLPGLFARACERWSVAGPGAFETGSVHPGGRRILEILEKDVGLASSVTATSWECLRDYGNLSSVSVLASLHLLMQRLESVRPEALGLLSAFGPGFAAELSLLEYHPAAA